MSEWEPHMQTRTLNDHCWQVGFKRRYFKSVMYIFSSMSQVTVEAEVLKGSRPTWSPAKGNWIPLVSLAEVLWERERLHHSENSTYCTFRHVTSSCSWPSDRASTVFCITSHHTTLLRSSTGSRSSSSIQRISIPNTGTAQLMKPRAKGLMSYSKCLHKWLGSWVFGFPCHPPHRFFIFVLVWFIGGN